ncbi:hypothetical protein L9F63_021453, partial [Diploptera punctata]
FILHHHFFDMKTILCLLLVGSCLLMQETVCGPIMTDIAGSTQFALELLQSTSDVVAGKYMNVAISPISVWSMLALLKEGSSGKTSMQLQKALHLSHSQKEVRTAFRRIQSVFHAANTGVELENAEAIFTDVNKPLIWQFHYLAENTYNSVILPVNYADPYAAVSYINDWVSNVTHREINRIVHEDDVSDPQLVIVNGLFFKGKWDMPFDTNYTKSETFYDDKGEELGEVMMMKHKAHLRYSSMGDLGARVVELPYQGGHYSMYIMVPHRGVTLDSVLEQLSTTPMDYIYNKMTEEDVDPGELVTVMLPRVVVDSDYVLNKALENMGIVDLFNDAKADLSGISTENLYLHKMIHKTRIVINEEGTVASSATGGVIGNREMGPVICANRPFLFLIVENSLKLVLFAGKIVNPHM